MVESGGAAATYVQCMWITPAKHYENMQLMYQLFEQLRMHNVWMGKAFE
jgi:hypothetical protein